MKLLKSFFAVLMALICVLGLSVVSLASTVYEPSQHSFVHDENGHYVLDVDIKASQFTDEQLAFWNSFTDALMGNSSGYVPFILYNKSGNELVFSLCKSDSYFFYYSSGSNSCQLNPNSGVSGAVTTLSIGISSGTVNHFINDYYYSKTLNITYSSNLYVFWGYGDLVSYDSRNGNNKDKINYVDWDGMRLQIQDDLGGDEEPDQPSSSEPSESIPDLPKPNDYNPTLPTIPAGDNLYVPYDTAVWDTFLERTKQNIGSATNIGFLIFGIAVVWSILTRLVKKYTKP